jgi:hypothetical protein
MERFAEELKEAQADEAALLADLTDAIKPNALAAEIARWPVRWKGWARSIWRHWKSWKKRASAANTWPTRPRT